jgi:hypothetical protein
MDKVWIYAGAGFAGFLWGAGSIRGEAALALMAGIWLGSGGGDVVVWAVIAMIAGYVIGSMVAGRKGQAAE